jgi:hypothetical protein
MRKLILILVAMLFSPLLAMADTYQANRCSAIFMIMTSVQTANEGLGKYFTQQGGMSGTLTGLYLGEETGKKVTNGMLSKLKSKEMTKIGNNYPSNLSQMENEISSCMGWTFAVGKVIQSSRTSMKNNNKAKQVLLSAPRPNRQYKYPFKDYGTIKSFIKVGFDSWVSMGKLTPQSFKDKLRKGLKK